MIGYIDLTTALRLDSGSQPGDRPFCIAFSGAGGKTTAMFQLARQMVGRGFARVFVTTTTQLAVSEIQLADHIVQPTMSSHLHTQILSQSGVILVCGTETNEHKMAGLERDALNRLYEIAAEQHAPLLIEADGSRRRPLKAPAEYEPVIPEYASHVIVVAGLSGLGMKLSEETVHRPQVFARLCDQEIGEVISPEMIAKVLSSPFGGLKGIPDHSKRILILNQIDTLKTFLGVSTITPALLAFYDQVLLAESGFSRRGVRAVYEPAVGIILAAGSARRFGATKQLASWRGKTVLQQVITTALAGNFTYLRVVIGYDRENILPVLQSMPEFSSQKFSVLENSAWSQGQSTSIRAALSSLPANTGSAVFLLADQPMVPNRILQVLQDVRAFTRANAVVPVYQGQRANPVLFGRELFSELGHLSGDKGGRALLQKASLQISWLPWDDPGLVLDIDTPSDYQKLNESDLK